MAKVLLINSSPIPKEKSISYELGQEFKKLYLQNNPSDEVIELNLSDLEVAHKIIDQNTFGEFFSDGESDKYIDQLKNVQKVIVTAPMINFNVSSLLKNYLDHVLVANKTFSYKYSKKGEAIGLLPHLKVQILATQGAPYGWYLWGNHVAYLKGTWEFAGAQVAEPILIDGTKLKEVSTLTAKEIVAKHHSKIQKAAKHF